MIATCSEFPKVDTRAQVPEDKMLPRDGSRLETRIPIDYLSIGSLIQAMMSAFVLESYWPAMQFAEEAGEFLDVAINTSFDYGPNETQAAVYCLLERLCNELDFHNYRLELVKEAPRHR